MPITDTLSPPTNNIFSSSDNQLSTNTNSKIPASTQISHSKAHKLINQKYSKHQPTSPKPEKITPHPSLQNISLQRNQRKLRTHTRNLLYKCRVKKTQMKKCPLESQVNHKMISIDIKGKEFLLIFEERNLNSQITNFLFLVPVSQLEGQVTLNEPIKLMHQVSARQMLLMQRFSQGFIFWEKTTKTMRQYQLVGFTWFKKSVFRIFSRV